MDRHSRDSRRAFDSRRWRVVVCSKNAETVGRKINAGTSENQTTDLGMITLKAIKPPEPANTPAKPNVIANGTYTGMIRIKFDASGKYTPLTIVPADIHSGTMTQSSRRGDMVVKYTGVWD